MLTAVSVPSFVGAADPPDLDRFMWALGKVESGGRYTAENSVSGAYGKYQILPSNWGAWARRYLGNASAPPTPKNQDIVARGRIIDLYEALADWAAVAHWWLTGNAGADATWSAASVRYVQRIMQLFGEAGGLGATTATAVDRVSSVTFQESSSTIAYSGRWQLAGYAAYSHGHVRYADARGASASFTFIGQAVTWYGPVGPTRGRARILVDGVDAAVVDLHRPAFRPSARVFHRSWPEAGRHTLTIEVISGGKRGLVAIDRFVVDR